MKDSVIPHTQQRSLIILLGIAFAIRLVIALSISTPLISDDREYHAIGVALADGKGFIADGQPTAFRAPGYPILLGFCYQLFGQSTVAIRCLHAIIDTFSCLLLFLIGEWLFGKRTGLIAAGILAVFPLHILYVARINTEIVFTFFFLLTVWLLICQRKENQLWFHLGLVGVVLGLTTLIKPIAAIFLIPCGWFIWQHNTKYKSNFLQIGFLTACFLLTLTPWMIRNYIVFSRFALTSNTGINLWIGNHPGANGGYSLPATTNPLSVYGTRFEQSDIGFKLAFDYALHHPQDYPVLVIRKLVFFFSSDFELMKFTQYKLAWNSYSNLANIIHELSIPIWVCLDVPFLALVVFGFVGMIGYSKKLNRATKFIIVLILIYIGVHLIFYGGARYRMPIMPFLMLFAAHGWLGWRSKGLNITKWKKFFVRIVLMFLIGIEIAEIVTLQLKTSQISQSIQSKESFSSKILPFR